MTHRHNARDNSFSLGHYFPVQQSSYVAIKKAVDDYQERVAEAIGMYGRQDEEVGE